MDGGVAEDQEEDEEMDLEEGKGCVGLDLSRFSGEAKCGHWSDRMEEVKMTSLGGKRWEMHARSYEFFFSFLVSPRFVFG
jgi:hypothetical protein